MYSELSIRWALKFIFNKDKDCMYPTEEEFEALQKDITFPKLDSNVSFNGGSGRFYFRHLYNDFALAIVSSVMGEFLYNSKLIRTNSSDEMGLEAPIERKKFKEFDEDIFNLIKKEASSITSPREFDNEEFDNETFDNNPEIHIGMLLKHLDKISECLIVESVCKDYRDRLVKLAAYTIFAINDFDKTLGKLCKEKEDQATK